MVDKVSWQYKNEIIFGTTLNTKSLDPASGYSGWFTVRYGVGETLFKLNDKMESIPWLAEGYEKIDNFTYKIRLKENIKFQNNKDVTPKEVKSSIERTLKLNPRAEDTLKISKIDTGENYIIITTKVENPTLINDLCEPYVSIIDVDEQNIDNSPIGTGPFKVKKFNFLKN